MSIDPNTLPSDVGRAAWSASTEIFGDPVALVLSVMGLGILVFWYARLGGPGTLERIPIRRHRVYPFIPPILLLTWVGLSIAANEAVSLLFGGRTGSNPAQITLYLFNVGLELSMIVLMLLLALFLFARGFKGLGLSVRTLGPDAQWSLVYLLAVYPLIFLGLWLTLFLGRLMEGPGFSLAEHQSLQLLMTTDSLLIRLLVAMFAVFIVPVFEELLFRGFLQSSISGWTENPWLAIVGTSLLFTILHPVQHQISLFFLSCALGYAYERSGSLFRPIMMHAFFNGTSVALSFSQITG